MNVFRLFITSLLLTVCALGLKAQKAQGFLAMGTTLDFYRSDIDKVEGFKPYIVIKGGYEILKSTEGSRSLMLEAAFTGRRYNMEYGPSQYRYYFTGLELSGVGAFSIAPKWSTEVGASAFFYNGALFSDNLFARFAGDFRTFDAMLLAGLNYRLWDQFAICSRFKMGLVPMLTYSTITDTGEMLPPKDDILARTIELTLRFYLP